MPYARVAHADTQSTMPAQRAALEPSAAATAARAGSLDAQAKLLQLQLQSENASLKSTCAELVRQPDAHFQSLQNPIGYALQLNHLGLTMGQILSLPMLIIGLWLIIKARQPLIC